MSDMSEGGPDLTHSNGFHHLEMGNFENGISNGLASGTSNGTARQFLENGMSNGGATNLDHVRGEDVDVAVAVAVEEEEADCEEEISAHQVLACLESAWTNEMCAPEILPHQGEMVELMMGQLEHMEENMRELDKNDFRYVVHQMELERIRYIMASYLRCRLQKIEYYTKWILEAEENRSVDDKYLSVEETRFAEGYYDCVEKHFEQLILQYLPTMQRSDAVQRIVRPNLMSHVFVKANESLPSVVIGVDDEEVDMAVGSQHIIPYQLISDLLRKDQVQLI